jgi:thiosulfate/3-mercaptopyruvate sulfurtransferase
MTVSPLLSVDELSQLVGRDPALVVLDVQWTLGRTDGYDRYLEAHVPGARYVDLDRELAAPASVALGRHPLPSHDDFQQTLRTLGVTGDSTLVVYDQSHSFSAARLWWLLRYAGLEARVLDGGLSAWVTGGHPVESGVVAAATPSRVEIDWDRLPTVSIDAAALFPASGVLLDARAGERYRGEVEPMDPRAGHIPGAVSAPTTGNLDAAGAFLPPAQLHERFTALGIGRHTNVAAYCGSGVTAAHELLALEVAGLRGALFPGSWSQWSHDASRPAAVGDSPGD